MQRALRNMLMTENGTEKLDNRLITTLFENIMTLALLHQFKRAEEKSKDKPHIEKKRHILNGHSIHVSTNRTHH